VYAAEPGRGQDTAPVRGGRHGDAGEGYEQRIMAARAFQSSDSRDLDSVLPAAQGRDPGGREGGTSNR
jgi:hypothetical protein